MKKKIRTSDLVGDLDKRSDENLKRILIFIGQDIWHDYSEVDRDIREELERLTIKSQEVKQRKYK